MIGAVHRQDSPILYFDNNATTALDPAVIEAMMPYLTDWYGNPSSAYGFGARVGRAVEHAREQVAALLGCEPREILFTSCGSEGNNTAIASALAADRDRKHVVTTTVEHSATKNYCEQLARRGYEVTWLPVDSNGLLDLAQVAEAIRSDTAIVTVMWANNETGVLYPVEEIARLARAHGAFFHTDAVQAVGKVPVDVTKFPVNFLSLAGHKLHAPKGVGALYVDRRSKFTPFLIGGGQESGRRGGTENVASIVALGKAAELAGAALEAEVTDVRALRDHFEQMVLEGIPGAAVNGDPVQRLPNTSNLHLPGVEGEALLVLLDKAGLCASAGSACTTGSLHPSHVLTAMGFSTERARSSLRFSFSRFNTADEIERGGRLVLEAAARLRAMRPAAVAA
jgi:cysteine desulfurase